MVSVSDACTDFENLDEILAELGTDVGAAEFHGMTAGLLSGGMQLSEQTWLDSILPHIGIESDPSDESAETLKALYTLTLSQLQDLSIDFEFQLVLPGDDFPIVDRLEALRDWCRGFLGGLGLASPQNAIEESPYLQESLQDMSAIAQLDPYSGGYGEEAESEFFELVEFVRMASQTVFTECGLDSPSSEEVEQPPQQLH